LIFPAAARTVCRRDDLPDSKRQGEQHASSAPSKQFRSAKIQVECKFVDRGGEFFSGHSLLSHYRFKPMKQLPILTTKRTPKIPRLSTAAPKTSRLSAEARSKTLVSRRKHQQDSSSSRPKRAARRGETPVFLLATTSSVSGSPSATIPSAIK
jgi:hypothetical protein